MKINEQVFIRFNLFINLHKKIMNGMTKNSKWVWLGNTTIKNCRQPRSIAMKSHTTITRHQEDKQSRAISSLFPIKMIAKLVWTQSNVRGLTNCRAIKEETIAINPDWVYNQTYIQPFYNVLLSFWMHWKSSENVCQRGQSTLPTYDAFKSSNHV